MSPPNRAGLASSIPAGAIRIDFYREELARHRECLEQQREYYSAKAIGDVEAALTRLMSRVDNLCTRKNGDEIVGRLLREIDVVTRLSVWSDQKNSH